jgi:hypothetical protein
MTELDRLFLTLRLALAMLGLSLLSPAAAQAMGEVAAFETAVSQYDVVPQDGTWATSAGAMLEQLGGTIDERPDEPSGRRRAWYRACQRRGHRNSQPLAALTPEPGSIPTLAPLYRTEQLQVAVWWHRPEGPARPSGGCRAPPQHGQR